VFVFCLFFLPLPFSLSTLSPGLVPSNNHYSIVDLYTHPFFTVIQFFVAGPLQRNTQFYLLETNFQTHNDNAILANLDETLNTHSFISNLDVYPLVWHWTN